MGLRFAKFVRIRTRNNKLIDARRLAAQEVADLPFLPQKQAARFCCVSLRQFQTNAKKYGIVPFLYMGKLCYRKEDLIESMEKERWRQRT